MNGDDSGASALCLCSQRGEWCSHTEMKVKLSSAAFMHPSRLVCTGWINPSILEEEDALLLHMHVHNTLSHGHMVMKATFTE